MKPLDANLVVDEFGLDFFRNHPSFSALSDSVLLDLFHQGTITRLSRGEYIVHLDEKAEDFQIVLKGRLAYYKHCGDHDVLTRHFCQGDQIGFDEMIGLIGRLVK